MINSKAKLAAVVATLLTTAYAGSANAYYSYNYGSYSNTYYLKGDRGPRGYTGYTGYTGARGYTGAAGPKGDKGPGLAIDTYVVKSCTVKTNDANCDGIQGDLLGVDENGNPRDLYVEASCGDDTLVSGGFMFKPNSNELGFSTVTHDRMSDDGSKWIAQAWIASHAYGELTAYAVCMTTYHTYDYNW